MKKKDNFDKKVQEAISESEILYEQLSELGELAYELVKNLEELKENLVKTEMSEIRKIEHINTLVSKVNKEDAVQMIEKGKTLQEVGKKYDVSRERIRQIYLRETGLRTKEVRDIQKTKTCEFCGKEFVLQNTSWRRRFCSYECRREFYLYYCYTLDVCKICGLAFLNPKSMGHHKEFCSKVCSGKYAAKNYGFGTPGNPPGNRKRKTPEEKKNYLLENYFKGFDSEFKVKDLIERFSTGKSYAYLLCQRGILFGIIEKVGRRNRRGCPHIYRLKSSGLINKD